MSQWLSSMIDMTSRLDHWLHLKWHPSHYIVYIAQWTLVKSCPLYRKQGAICEEASAVGDTLCFIKIYIY